MLKNVARSCAALGGFAVAVSLVTLLAPKAGQAQAPPATQPVNLVCASGIQCFTRSDPDVKYSIPAGKVLIITSVDMNNSSPADLLEEVFLLCPPSIDLPARWTVRGGNETLQFLYPTGITVRGPCTPEIGPGVAATMFLTGYLSSR